MQFYLLWPAVVWLLLRWRGRGAVFYVAIAGALASTAWMAFLAITNGYPQEADPSRAYFGSDSHIMGLLLGAALAMVWRPGRLSTRLTVGAKAVITTIGIVALLTVIWFFWAVGEYSNFIYRGGFLAVPMYPQCCSSYGTCRGTAQAWRRRLLPVRIVSDPQSWSKSCGNSIRDCPPDYGLGRIPSGVSQRQRQDNRWRRTKQLLGVDYGPYPETSRIVAMITIDGGHGDDRTG